MSRHFPIGASCAFPRPSDRSSRFEAHGLQALHNTLQFGIHLIGAMFKRQGTLSGYVLVVLITSCILLSCWWLHLLPSARWDSRAFSDGAEYPGKEVQQTDRKMECATPSPAKNNGWRSIPERLVVSKWQDTQQAKMMEPKRTDVLTVTPWLAPIVWDGTFDPVIIDEAVKSQRVSIATTVFAVAKYIRYLQDFLETAEKHYMVGLAVRYYVFTDQPGAVPVNMTLGPGRTIKAIKVPKHSRWQEISMSRMEHIQKAIEEDIRYDADYVFCVDVDMKFHSRVGAEILGRLVAVLNPWLHKSDRNNFSYERSTKSTAFIPYGKGDFYYAGGFFGGAVDEVHSLVKACRANLELDKKVGVEAKWQEESHVNRYLVTNKPTKVLSPEYVWDEELGKGGSEIKLIRYATIRKNMKEVRENI